MEGRAVRIGHGYDVHRLVEGRKLILGGVEIPYERGLLGHSDADVLTHAVMDALLGACALGDIGHLFPDSDPAFAGADSLGRPSTFLSWRHPPFAAGRRGTGWILVNAALCCDFRYLDTCILPARPAGLWFGGYNVKRTRANRTAL